MLSSLHTMIDKAHRYAAEPDRLHLIDLAVRIDGDNSSHTVRLADDRLTCDCDHFAHEAICAHVLTTEKVFKPYLSGEVVPFPGLENGRTPVTD